MNHYSQTRLYRWAPLSNGEVIREGTCVELHPVTDAWMMGDRYGEVQTIGKRLVHVLCDKSGQVRKLTHDKILKVVK